MVRRSTAAVGAQGPSSRAGPGRRRDAGGEADVARAGETDVARGARGTSRARGTRALRARRRSNVVVDDDTSSDDEASDARADPPAGGARSARDGAAGDEQAADGGGRGARSGTGRDATADDGDGASTRFAADIIDERVARVVHGTRERIELQFKVEWGDRALGWGWVPAVTIPRWLIDNLRPATTCTFALCEGTRAVPLGELCFVRSLASRMPAEALAELALSSLAPHGGWDELGEPSTVHLKVTHRVNVHEDADPHVREFFRYAAARGRLCAWVVRPGADN
ncbi:hypothetical protein KFE25_011756, partial [Diacronema lutheri]